MSKKSIEYNGNKYKMKEDNQGLFSYQLGNIGLASLEEITDIEDSDDLEYLDLSYNK